jgi:cell division protein FtsW (lipid II flippase)
VPTDRDVVTALFGAATGLAGLLLVFLGITISTFQSYSAAVPAAAVAPYRRAARGILAAFLVGLGTAVICLVWLLSPHRGLRDAAVVLFFVQLAAVAVSAVSVARLILWR